MNNKKVALVSGITGQDGSYMADILLEKGYEVYGIIRRSSTPITRNIEHILDKIKLLTGDLTDATSINKIVQTVNPDVVFNLGSMSHVRLSYDIPVYTGWATGLAATILLEAIKNYSPDVKYYQASSSEMFGKVQAIPQNEKTPFYPRSPYGCAKAYAFYITRAYREGYKMRTYNGILFNHESPRRGENFITRKVVKAALEIKNGLRKTVSLGNLDAKRDWGYSREYMEAIQRFVETQEPDDFVLATGETHTVEEFVSEVFNYYGLGDWKQYVVIDENLKRPAEVDLLLGDYSRAQQLIGFEPKIKFHELIKLMCENEKL